MKILILTQRMSLGYGVSVVVDALYRRMQSFTIQVGCLHFDQMHDYCFRLHPDQVLNWVKKQSITHVIAHSSPYFEILPQIKPYAKVWAWEHGDPSPRLFHPHEQEERQKIIDHKIQSIYPHLDHIIAISHYIKQSIRCPQAHVIWNGADHIPLCPPQPNLNQPLKIGTLMRLGQGESYYKGNALYLELVHRLNDQGFKFYLMGKGHQTQARPFQKAGVQTYLNATEAQKIDYLRQLDVFISLSLWEGFNLPLVEAQRSGCLSLALDVGAHPEVCPMICSDLDEMIDLIRALDQNRSLLYAYQKKIQKWNQNRFNWQKACQKFQNLIDQSTE